MTVPETHCSVCGDPGDDDAIAICGQCDRPFHLNQRNDADGKDCGAVWIDEQYLALRFACFTCLPQEGGAPEPPVGSGH